jgi:hypothetical protein
VSSNTSTRGCQSLILGQGSVGGAELWKELQGSHFGIVCYTADNLEAPWLHFEAGALAKAVEGRVCPYLYKIQPSAVRGPLSQFQMKRANEKETRELLHAINDASTILNQRGLRSADLDDAFETWWPKLEADLKAVPPSKTAVPPRRGTQEIAEEILGIVRDLDRRFPAGVFETGNVSDIPLGALRNRKLGDVRKLLFSEAPKLSPEVIERWLQFTEQPLPPLIEESQSSSDAPQGGEPPQITKLKLKDNHL